jgi:cytochrome d ubiquinol oxidase subunit I
VGDIFGAPLAIEGILAFFMEATFIAVMFFGWDKVSKRFHLASTWLTGLGATISAWWILVANAWMQNPVGMEFNPDTARNEMVDFWAVATSPMAVNKFFHSVLSGWVLAAVFVVGVSCWYLWKKREKKFALASVKIAAWVGLCAAVLSAWTGDGSGYQVAQKQPQQIKQNMVQTSTRRLDEKADRTEQLVDLLPTVNWRKSQVKKVDGSVAVDQLKLQSQ